MVEIYIQRALSLETKMRKLYSHYLTTVSSYFGHKSPCCWCFIVIWNKTCVNQHDYCCLWHETHVHIAQQNDHDDGKCKNDDGDYDNGNGDGSAAANGDDNYDADDQDHRALTKKPAYPELQAIQGACRTVNARESEETSKMNFNRQPSVQGSRLPCVERPCPGHCALNWDHCKSLLNDACRDGAMEELFPNSVLAISQWTTGQPKACSGSASFPLRCHGPRQGQQRALEPTSQTKK